MATDSFTSTCSAVATPVGLLSDPRFGNSVLTRVGNFGIRVTPSGVTISKASTFGGTQNTLSFPISLDAARDLAVELLKVVS